MVNNISVNPVILSKKLSNADRPKPDGWQSPAIAFSFVFSSCLLYSVLHLYLQGDYADQRILKEKNEQSIRTQRNQRHGTIESIRSLGNLERLRRVSPFFKL